MVLPYSPTAFVESLPPGGSSMNGMNLSGKPGIVQPMQMPPTFGQPPTPLIQPRLGTLHFTAGPQQPSLTMHFGRAVLGGEVALLVVAGPVAALVHGVRRTARWAAARRRAGSSAPARWPCRAGRSASRTGCPAGSGSRARRRSGCRPWTSSPSPGSRARPSRRSGCPAIAWMPPYVAQVPTATTAGGLGRQPVEPLAGGHRLAGRRVVAEPAPVALVVQLLVGDRPLDDQHERLELAAVGLEEPLEEVVGAAGRAALEVDQRPVHGDLGQARQGAERDLLDAGLGRGGQRDGVAVTAESGVDPQDVDQGLLGA